MITAAIWVAKIQKAGKWSYAVLIPALFLWITVTAGLVWYIVFIPNDVLGITPAIVVKTILGIGLILNFLLAYDFYVAWKKPTEAFEEAPA